MIYWEMQRKEGVQFYALQPDGLTNAIAATQKGIHPASCRQVFYEAGALDVRFQLTEKDGLTRVTKRVPIADFQIWGWVPIFSERAFNLYVELGGEASEFWPCHFDSNPGEKFYLHLPVSEYDVVDFERSKFKHSIQLDPPIPIFIQTLVLRGPAPHLPPCFRSLAPSHKQVLAELFVSDSFKSAWEQNGFTGADFKKIM